MKKLIAIPALCLAACASQPKPCTAEWVDWKTQRFFDEFFRDHREDVIELRGLTANLNTQDKSLGNIAIHSKIRILRAERNDGWGLAAILQLELPTGDPSRFAGDPTFVIWPHVVGEWRPVRQFRMNLDVGYRLVIGDGAPFPVGGRTMPMGGNATMPSAIMGGSNFVYLTFDEAVEGFYKVRSYVQDNSTVTIESPSEIYNYFYDDDAIVHNLVAAPPTGSSVGQTGAVAGNAYTWRVRLSNGSTVSLNDDAGTANSVTLEISVQDVEGNRRDEVITLPIE